MGDKPLSAALERFCVEVVRTSNQSEAYRIAFPLCKKWKREESVWQAGSKLAAEPRIRERIAELKERVITQPGIMAATEVLLTISRIARADARKLFNTNGTLKAPHEIDDETAIALVEYNGRDMKAKLADKLGAARELLRHYHLLSGFVPPPPDGTSEDGKTIEGELTSHDLARRIAFALTQGARKQLPVQPST